MLNTSKEIRDFKKVLIKKGLIPKVKIEIPTPEYLDDLKDLDYNKVDAVRNSELTYLDKSPAHWKAWKDRELEESEAFVTGRMLHRAILEEHLFLNELAIKQDSRTKAGKEINESFLKEGKMLVSEKDLIMVQKIAQNLKKDKLIKKMFEGAMIETPFLFSHKGLLCKAKIDVFKPKKFCLDVKFVVDAKPETFCRKAENYGYDRQASFYKLALQAHKLTAPKMKYYLLAIEKTPPYAYSLIEISQGVLKQGNEKVNLLLDKYKNTVARGNFEGYHKDVWQSY